MPETPVTEALRCKVTGNLCGTDTWMVGRPCKCDTCQQFLWDQHEAAVARLAEKAQQLTDAHATIQQKDQEIATVTQQRDKWLVCFNRSEEFQNGPLKRAEAAEAKLEAAEATLTALRHDLAQQFKINDDVRAMLYATNEKLAELDDQLVKVEAERDTLRQQLETLKKTSVTVDQ